MTLLSAISLAAVLAASPAGQGSPRWAVAVLPSGHEFSLEIAATPEERARGYMFREAVAPREGMLFVFEEAGGHGFWMKNCRTSLDIVWLDAQWRVVDLAENLPPCPPDGACPTHEPEVPARYVLEFAAGTARAEKLALGQSVVVLSVPPLR